MPRAVHRESGFTLVELVMVLIILGVLSAVAIVRWPTGIDAAPTALQLAEDIRLAQSLSMNRGGGFGVSRITSQQYRIVEDGGTFTTRTTDASVADFSLLFDSYGRPLNANQVPLANPTVISIANGLASVTVQPETGLIEAP